MRNPTHLLHICVLEQNFSWILVRVHFSSAAILLTHAPRELPVLEEHVLCMCLGV